MRQAELFPPQAVAPPPLEVPGFSLREEYLTRSEEIELLTSVEQGPWETDWRRRIQQFGYGYKGQHGGRPVWVRDFPEWLSALGARVAADAQFGRLPQNCVINEYIPPQGIAPHTDYSAFGARIACVSLGSDVVMDLIRAAEYHKLSVPVPARSLWVLAGEARTDWQHGIAPRFRDIVNGVRRARERRVSITFRTLRTET